MLKDYRRIGLVWILALFVGTPGLLAQSADDLPILEAVLRYEIGLSLRDSTPRTTGAERPFAFCVQVRSGARSGPVDPDASLLARFRDDRPPVKPGSACDVRDWKVYDRSSGKPGGDPGRRPCRAAARLIEGRGKRSSLCGVARSQERTSIASN
jgi:hypothetical protein